MSSPDGVEQPQYGDNAMERLIAAVHEFGPHAVEVNECPHCGSMEFDVHPFAESMSCGRCGKRYKSQVERGCDFHDTIILKMREAVQQVKDWYPAELFGKGGDDSSALSPEVQAIVMRKAAHMARVVCDNILAEFERLLEYEVESPAIEDEPLEDEEEPDGEGDIDAG
jgi:hypothetical protein